MRLLWVRSVTKLGKDLEVLKNKIKQRYRMKVINTITWEEWYTLECKPISENPKSRKYTEKS